MISASAARDQLQKLRLSMFQGSRLDVRVEDDQLWLNIIRVPSHAPSGTGSKLLARVLEVADRAQLFAMLEADPTDLPEDPDTFHLVRWYERFGFERQAITEDGVLMSRNPKPPQPWEKILTQAQAAPRLTQDEFNQWREHQEQLLAAEDARSPPRKLPGW